MGKLGAAISPKVAMREERRNIHFKHSNSLELIAHCEAMHTGCYLNESIDFSSIASLHISSSERYWLNRSLIVWHASGGCLKTYFNPLSLFFGIISLYSVVLVTGVIMTFLSARVLIFPPVNVFCRDKLWLYSSLNLAACDLVRCLFAVPMVIYSHSTTNWWLGEMICIGHISMQIMPIIVTEFTHLLIALDRYMSVKHPNWMCRPKFSTFSILAVWVFCALTVLPLKGYVNYFNLHTLFGTSFYEQAVCAVKAGMDTRERNVAFFIALYLIPSATIAYFYSKTHNELRRQIAGEQINQTILHSFDRSLRPWPDDEGELALESQERFTFTKASPDLQLALSIQLRNNALIFGLCSLPVQVVYVVAALLSTQLVDVLIVCGFLIVSLSPIIKSANILLNRRIYWKFMAYDGHQSRPPRSVSEEYLRHK